MTGILIQRRKHFVKKKYCGVEYDLGKTDFGCILSFKGTKMNSKIKNVDPVLAF